MGNAPEPRRGVGVITKLAAVGAVVAASLGISGSVSAESTDALSPGEKICWDASGAPGDYSVANLTPVRASGAGNGQMYKSGITPNANNSNVNFNVGTVDPNVAIAEIGADGQVCFKNSPHSTVDLVVDDLGSIAAAAYTPATPNGAADRKVDTREAETGPTGKYYPIPFDQIIYDVNDPCVVWFPGTRLSFLIDFNRDNRIDSTPGSEYRCYKV